MHSVKRGTSCWVTGTTSTSGGGASATALSVLHPQSVTRSSKARLIESMVHDPLECRTCVSRRGPSWKSLPSGCMRKLLRQRQQIKYFAWLNRVQLVRTSKSVNVAPSNTVWIAQRVEARNSARNWQKYQIERPLFGGSEEPLSYECESICRFGNSLSIASHSMVRTSY